MTEKATPAKKATNETSAIKSAQLIIKNAIAELQSSIEGIASQEAELKRRAQFLERLPVSLKDFTGFVMNFVEECGSKFFAAHGGILSARSHETKLNAVGWADLCRYAENGSVSAAFPEWHLQQIRNASPFDAMCFFFPEMVHQRLVEKYHHDAANKWGNEEHPRIAQRASELKDIERDLEELASKKARLTAELNDLTGEVAPVDLDPVLAQVQRLNQTAGVGFPLKGQRLTNPELASSR